MGFQQGLSGLNVSSKALDAISNNVSNASTVGYKASQVQFSDVYAASLMGGGASQIGIGAAAPSVAQLFTQGNITTTNNPLDLAINGGGFFVLANPDGTKVYSRNGQFNVDKSGYIVSTGGLRLQGYGVDENSQVVRGDPIPLRLITTNIEPKQTTEAAFQLNLDSRSTPPSSMSKGRLTGENPLPATGIVIDGSNDQVALTIDGISATVSIPHNTYTRAQLSSQLEEAINNHPTFAAAGALADVSIEPSTGKLVVESRSQGSLGLQGGGSTVRIGTSNGVGNLFGTAPVSLDGVDNFRTNNTGSYTASTAMTVYDSLGNPHNLTLYFAKTSFINNWQMYTALDGGLTTTPATQGVLTGGTYPTDPAVIATIDNGGTLDLLVDGVPQAITIPAAAPASYATATDMANAINAAGLVGATASVVNGALTFTSNTIGARSDVRVVSNSFSDAILTIPATAGTLTGGVFSPSGTVDAGGTLNLIIDGGVTPVAVTIPPLTAPATYDATSLAAAINSATTLAGPPVVATAAMVDGRIVITSAATGNTSSVELGDPSDPLAEAIFGSSPTVVDGADADLDGTSVAGTDGLPQAQIISFNQVGGLETAMPLTLSFEVRTGAQPMQFTLDLTGTSQYGINFGVNQLLQDGYTSGRLSGISVSNEGVIQGRYSNGKSRDMGQLVLVNFNNPNGLASLGGNVWAETQESGPPMDGPPGQGNLGLIQSAAVEESNVDLTAELVAMIMQQRVYQANAQSIKTQDQVLQTLVNLR